MKPLWIGKKYIAEQNYTQDNGKTWKNEHR